MFELLDAPLVVAPLEIPAGFVAPQGITTLRWASAGYATRTADVPASTIYTPRVTGDILLAQSAMDAIGLGGVVAVSAGDVPLWDADDALADLDRYGVADRRTVRVRVMPVRDPVASDFGNPLGAATLAFTGVVASVRRTAGRQGVLSLGDLTERLNVPLQPTRYAGTGGTSPPEGGAELKDQPKPVCVGRVFNIAPVYVGVVNLGDGALNTYQVHWRGVQAVDAVRIRGVEQTIVGTAPTTGQARIWASQGLFQLGSTPDGAVTADVRGDATPVYVSTTGAIIRRLLESLGPQLSASDFDQDSLTIADNDLPGEVGFYVGAEPITAMQAVQTIAAGAGAVVCGSRVGMIRVFDPIANAAPQFTLTDGLVLECSPVPMPASVRPIPIAAAVRWKPNGAPLQDVAAGVAAASRQALQATASGPERAIATATNSRQAQQRDLVLPGLYWAQSDAAARASRWATWLDHGPRAFEITTDRFLGQIECGHIGHVTYPAYGLQTGARGVVMAWREALAGRRVTFTFVTIPET